MGARAALWCCVGVSVFGCGRVEDGRTHQPAQVGDAGGTGGATTAPSTTGGTAGVPHVAGGATSTASSTGGMAGGETSSGGWTANGNGGMPNVTPPSPVVVDDGGGHPIRPDAAAAADAGSNGNRDGESDAGARRDAVPSTTSPPSLSVASFDRPLTGITAAAWSRALRHFFLLESAANRFWRVDPATSPAAVQGPYAIPSGVVAPRAFAVSESHVFAIVDAGIHRLPLEGAASGTPVPLSGAPDSKELMAAHTGGTFLVGDLNGPAQALADGEDSTRLFGTYSVSDGGVEAGLVVSMSGLYGVGQIASNGADFAVSMKHAPYMQAHVLAPASLELNPSPCNIGTVVNLFSQLAVSGSTIAWIERLPFSHPVRLHSARVVDGVCADLGFVEFGMSLDSATALGLVDENLALVVDHATGYTADVAIIDRRTGAMVGAHLTNLNIGSYPIAFEVGLPRHAVLVSKDRPALLEF